MGLIREPLDVDFVVDPRPLTKEEEKATTKADKRLKRINRAKKAAMAAGAAALLAKGKENSSGEEGWKPSGVV
jgi:hypothetical protein